MKYGLRFLFFPKLISSCSTTCGLSFFHWIYLELVKPAFHKEEVIDNLKGKKMGESGEIPRKGEGENLTRQERILKAIEARL